MKPRNERTGKMQDRAADVAKDWLSLALAGLGITFAPAHEWLGGMLLGLAMAGLASKLQPEKDRMELFWVMLSGFLTSHLAALAAQVWLPAAPIQLAMMAGGFGSRFLTRFALKALGVLEGRAGRIVDGAIDKVLPMSGGGGNQPTNSPEDQP